MALVRTLVLTRHSLVEQRQGLTQVMREERRLTTPRTVDGTNQAVEVARVRLVKMLEPMAFHTAVTAVSE